MIEPLLVPTPDGSGQAVHPDVVDTVVGFRGARYWMACTPYPFFNDRLENPLIRISDDGVVWRPVPGAPDPLVPAPAAPTWHWSDTDLTLHDGTLHLVFRGCERGRPEAQLLLTTSEDGVSWTEPKVFWEGMHGLSPALLVEDGRWSMWHIECNPADLTEPVRTVRHDGPGIGVWDEVRECSVEVPGHLPWHLDVQRVGGRYEALLAAFPAGTNSSRCRLFHLVSDDGLHFRLSRPKPVIAPSWRLWATRMIYRSTFLYSPEDGYRIWYSGSSWGMRCGIGLAEGGLDALRFRGGPATVGTRQRLKEELRGRVNYIEHHHLPPFATRLLKAARTLLRR